MVTRERSRWEIILDVLKAIQEESRPRKTRIMQRAYLDWRNFERYFDFLLEEGFIAREGSTSDVYYKLTEKGQGILTRLQEVNDIAGSKWSSKRI